MNKKTPFLIEVNLEDYNKIDSVDDLVFIKLNDDGSENVIDRDLERLIKYVYDDIGRCVENIIYENEYAFGDDGESLLHYRYHSTVYHSYLEKSPLPFRSKYGSFWVANKYDKNDNLIQSVTSKGSTLIQKFVDDALVEKRFKIQTDKIREYVFRFEADSDRYFVEYEDSEGNYWNEATGFDCPFENPVRIRTKFNDNNEFI